MEDPDGSGEEVMVKDNYYSTYLNGECTFINPSCPMVRITELLSNIWRNHGNTIWNTQIRRWNALSLMMGILLIS